MAQIVDDIDGSISLQGDPRRDRRPARAVRRRRDPRGRQLPPRALHARRFPGHPAGTAGHPALSAGHASPGGRRSRRHGRPRRQPDPRRGRPVARHLCAQFRGEPREPPRADAPLRRGRGPRALEGGDAAGGAYRLLRGPRGPQQPGEPHRDGGPARRGTRSPIPTSWDRSCWTREAASPSATSATRSKPARSRSPEASSSRRSWTCGREPRSRDTT